MNVKVEAGLVAQLREVFGKKMSKQPRNYMEN